MKIYSLSSRGSGIKAREIARELGLEKTEISRWMVSSALMRELCYQDKEYNWHALVRQQPPYEGLYEFSGWYGTVPEFMAEDESTWLNELEQGCRRIGRNLNDTRGLIHSFRDCRETMRRLFEDLREMSSLDTSSWEIVFELRMNRARWIRIYADVLLITRERVFSLEYKMKNVIDPDEIAQAAKYGPYLEVVFGEHYDIIPALVLTGTSDLFRLEPVGREDALIAVCSGDMLFNVLNEYMGFLQ